MNYYGPDNNRRGKTGGIIAIVIYVAVWLVLFFTLQFKMERNLSEEGILIDFGTMADGAGETESTLSQMAAAPTVSQPRPADDMMTRDDDDAPEVPLPTPDQNRTRPGATEEPREQVRQPDPEEVETPREVNPRALFPGRNPASDSSSAGSGTQEGNQGAPSGDVGGTGVGTEGENAANTYDHSFSLDGRKLVGSFPSPAHPGKNKSGRVIIEIIVDGHGDVISARYRASGSTTQDGELIGAARNAALKAKFSADENNPVQTGTITYIFRLN